MIKCKVVIFKLLEKVQSRNYNLKKFIFQMTNFQTDFLLHDVF